MPSFKYVSCHGLLGTYDDGREWLKQPHLASRPKTILHLGSSIGLFPLTLLTNGLKQLIR